MLIQRKGLTLIEVLIIIVMIGILLTIVIQKLGGKKNKELISALQTDVRNAQAAGLTLNEIGGITQLRDEGTTPCTHVSELLDAKLRHVRHTIKQLRTLEHELVALVKRSRTLDPADCTDNETCHILTRHDPHV